MTVAGLPSASVPFLSTPSAAASAASAASATSATSASAAESSRFRVDQSGIGEIDLIIRIRRRLLNLEGEEGGGGERRWVRRRKKRNGKKGRGRRRGDRWR